MPTLEEGDGLAATLDHLAQLAGEMEVVVSDGGSEDRTLAIAGSHPVVDHLVRAPRGRALQMNAGAAAGTGPVVLFLHADTRLPPDYAAQIASALADPAVAGGNFRLLFDGGGLFSRFLALVYATQRRWGVFYGDSAIFVRRGVFDACGGFPDQEIMEDFEMARRIARHGRAACLAGPAITSSRRWRRAGVVRTVLTWLTVRWLYQFGVSPSRLGRLYRVVR